MEDVLMLLLIFVMGLSVVLMIVLLSIVFAAKRFARRALTFVVTFSLKPRWKNYK